MSFEIELTDEANSDVDRHKKSGDKKVLIKIDKLLEELRKHPMSETGKPEIMKHYRLTTWSRRISDKHRMVYRIENEKVIVLVLSLWGHYDDK